MNVELVLLSLYAIRYIINPPNGAWTVAHHHLCEGAPKTHRVCMGDIGRWILLAGFRSSHFLGVRMGGKGAKEVYCIDFLASIHTLKRYGEGEAPSTLAYGG